MYRRISILIILIITLCSAGTYAYLTYKENTLETASSIVPLEEFIIKINNTEGNGHVYVKLNFSLELDSNKEILIIQENMPKIRDSIYNYFYSLTEADLNKSTSIHLLREQITWRLNKVLKPIRVNNVLFNDFIVG